MTDESDELTPQEDEEKRGWPTMALGILLMPIVGLFWLLGILWRFWFVTLIIVAVLFGIGVLHESPSRSTAPDSSTCPGFHYVRDLQTSGAIDTFAATVPKDGWKCEYSLDNDDAILRFRKGAKELEVEIEGREGSEALLAAERRLSAAGYR